MKAFIKANKAPRVSLSVDNKTTIINPFILFVSNSNEMGYSLSLTPQASLKDGKLDLVYINNVSFLNKIFLAGLMVIKKIKKSKLIHYQTIKKLKITNTETASFLIQIDGESERLDTETVSVEIKEKALNVIVP